MLINDSGHIYCFFAIYSVTSTLTASRIFRLYYSTILSLAGVTTVKM